jgi:Fe2+ or Zn2+ uptake regulation protein
MNGDAVQRSFQESELRCTAQRYAAMAFFMENNSHPTAAELRRRNLSRAPLPASIRPTISLLGSTLSANVP